MSQQTQIPEIGAELLLNLLYPELEERWVAHHDGTFYRNYNRDVLELDPEQASVRLSRDSILGLLPQGLLAPEDDLRKGDPVERHKERERQLKLLTEAFLPFDTLAFRRQLRMERSVSELLNGKIDYLLKTYFGFDLAAETNPYVKEAAVLLLYVRQRRGDFGLVRGLLSSLFHCPVRMEDRRYSEMDSTRWWLPVVRYEMDIPGLTPAAFRRLSKDILPLQDFLSEWFMPWEVKLDIVIRQHGKAPRLNRRLTLDYNAEL